MGFNIGTSVPLKSSYPIVKLVVANKLKTAGLIKNSLSFRIYTQITGKAKKISAGEFQLPNNLSLFKVVEELMKGPKGLWVTIPDAGENRINTAHFFAEANLAGSGPSATTWRGPMAPPTLRAG